MKLNVTERLRLLAILPEQGNILTLKIVRKLREELSFDEEEHKRINLVVTNERITWNDEAEDKEVEFGETAMTLVRDCLEKLDGSDELLLADVDLWDKFIGLEVEE